MAIVAWVGGLLINRTALDTNLGWTVSMYRQKAAIADAINQPGRILLVGGSSTHFSFDARQVEQALRRPTINFGLHAGLGLDAILASVEPHVHRGDLVVVIPEYGILGDEALGYLAGPYGAAINRMAVGAERPQQIAAQWLKAGVVNLPALGRTIMRLLGSQGKNYEDVDERGDAVRVPAGTAVPAVLAEPMAVRALDRLVRFRQSMDRAGATMVIALPWALIPAGDTISRPAVERIAASLASAAPVIHGDNFDLQTDRGLFADTFYHPNAGGRQQRTAEFITHLRALVPPAP